MIGPNPYKIVYDLIRHDDAINGTHTLIARSENLENVRFEQAVYLDANVNTPSTAMQIYKTDINGYGVVMGRERVKDQK